MLSSAAGAQDKHEFSGMLLTNRQGELCTMCEATMTCTPAAELGTAAPVTYHFKKRDFWGQMSTVLDYFPFTRSFGLRHTRPVEVAGAAAKTMAMATFNLETKRIDVPDASGVATWVDRGDGSWHAADGAVIGVCSAPPI
jgi:hypothetical protein